MIDDIIKDEVARQGGLEPPKFVKAAAKLGDDLKMLRALTETKVPPRVPVRATELAAGYMFGDASGRGFGTSLLSEETGMIELTYVTMGVRDDAEIVEF
jgi:hypothetical protein